MIHPGIDKVIALLREAGEERFDMNSPCGSPCCIGGHCMKKLSAYKDMYSGEIDDALSEFAVIPFEDAFSLCFPSPRSGFIRYVFGGVGYSEITLSDAIGVLEHYRDTGIVDWSPVSQRLEREAV